MNDAATAWLPSIPAGSGSVSNSQCTLLGSGSSASISGNQVTRTYNIQFQAAFAGEKTLWTNAYSASSGLGSTWPSTLIFSWTVSTATPIVPTLVSFSPASGSGSAQAFSAVYSSAAGGGDIDSVELLINSVFNSPHSCFLGYSKGQFLLLNDAGTAWLAAISAGSGSVSNSQCTLLGSGSGLSVSGNQATFVFNLQFQAAFAGQKSMWTNAYSASSGLGSAWPSTQSLSWTVSTSAPVGSVQAFTAVYSSTAGGGDIDAVQILWNPVLLDQRLFGQQRTLFSMADHAQSFMFAQVRNVRTSLVLSNTG